MDFWRVEDVSEVRGPPVRSAVPEPRVESEVDPSIDHAPTSDSSSSVNLVISDVLDGKSVIK